MNFRVALQYEFTALGLDNCLDRLGNHESDELAVQITAYVDNVVDVHDLMEEAETKQAAIDQVADLEEELSRVTERLTETEADAMSRQVRSHFNFFNKNLFLNFQFNMKPRLLMRQLSSSWYDGSVRFCLTTISFLCHPRVKI